MHKHHKIPRHAGGTDSANNIILLTVEQHADAHKLLWEQHGKLQDKLAWKMLSSKTEEAELIRVELSKLGFQNMLADPERKSSWINNISTTLTGRKQSDKTKIKRAISLRNAHKDPILKQKMIDAQTPERREASRIRIFDGLGDKMANGRKSSDIWRKSVTSQESKDKHSLADPRRKPVIIDDVVYVSIRAAARITGHKYSHLLRQLFLQNTKFIRFSE